MHKTAVVICPGRGSYNKPELGYLKRYHDDRADVVAAFDANRRELGQTPLVDLDAAAAFSIKRHTRGDNASALIYAASLFDAQTAGAKFDVVAATGNSMGWYIALAAASVVSPQGGFEVVNTMGTLMQQHLIGGQMLYPLVDENWRPVAGLQERVLDLIDEIANRPGHSLYVSIRLGGMLVVAGDAAGLAAFDAGVSRVQDRFPLRLPNHAAFHTVLQEPVARAGQARLNASLFLPPSIPLIDGDGSVWYPKTCTADQIRHYTLGRQVTETYDFTAAVQVAARTFAPDFFILTGPGNSLGAAVAQALIDISWKGIADKKSFLRQQQQDPLLISMGRPEDRQAAFGDLN